MKYEFRERNCNICGKDAAVFLGLRFPRNREFPESLRTRIVRCMSCGLIYPNPMPTADQEQTTSNYSDPNQYFPFAISAARMQFYHLILQRIEALHPQKGRLLDVGSGRGELLSVATQRGWRASGVEISSSFCEYAKKRFGVDVFCGDVSELNSAPESYDAICLVSVLQYVQDPKKLLATLQKLLKKQGILYIEIANQESIFHKAGNLYYKLRGKGITVHLSPTFPSYQLYGFTNRSLGRILETSGFEVLGMAIKGGGIASLKSGGVKRGVFGFGMMLLSLLANLPGQGQVLEAFARKQ